MKLSLIAIATLALLCVDQSGTAFGQPSTVESLGFLSSNYRSSTGKRVSDDGSVIVGISNSVNNNLRGFRWTVQGGMQELAPLHASLKSEAWGVSGDGSVVVGFTSAAHNQSPRAVRWLASGERRDDYVPASFHESFAYGISGDGTLAVGYGRPTSDFVTRALRFTTTTAPYDFGSIEGSGGSTSAFDVSRDGSVVVGNGSLSYNEGRAFRWTPQTGVENLGTLKYASSALAVSDDGQVIVGRTAEYYGNDYTFVWTSASGMQHLPAFAGIPAIGAATDVSADGSVIVGRSQMPPNRSFTNRGGACVWRNGQIRSLWDLLEHEYPADLTGWSTFDSVEGISADGTTLTGHGLYLGDRTAFRVVFRNSSPTIAPIAPKSVECEGDSNLVTLTATVGDNGDRVTIRWKVNGQTIQTQTDTAAGATNFEYDFPHGQSSVVLEVTDGEFTATTGTTVTVSDTTAPTLLVAADVIVPTDAGKDFATNVTPTPPQVYDVCDGDPQLSNDAPAQFPVGETTVHWTATDADGNQSTTNQKVIVEDRESPVLSSASNVAVYCDRGRGFATLQLTPPGAVDNVTDSVVVMSDAGSRFRIGRTNVKWTATDEAGNAATTSMTVEVVNRLPRARAGKTVRIETKSERGVRIRLDGSTSSDPDGHALSYSWRAAGVRFVNSKVAKPLGTFPVGTTVAKLTVRDEAGAKHAASVRVIVRLANSEERPRGTQANASFDAGAASAQRAAESGSASEARLAGLAHSAAAQRLGIQAGERIRWEEGGSPTEAKMEYAALRAEQRRHGALAANAWLHAYAEAGDDAALDAAIDALQGEAYAEADLAGR